MKHSFKLKSQEAGKESSVLYKCYFNGIRFTYGTGIKIFPELWDTKSEFPTKDRAILKLYKSEIPDLNSKLTNIEIRINNIKSAVEGFISNCQTNNQAINQDALKAYLDKTARKSDITINKISLNKSKADPRNDQAYIQTYLKQFINEIRNGKRTISTGKSKGNRYSLGTIKNYLGLSVQLKNFDKTEKLKFEDLSIAIYNEFIQHCNKCNLSKNFTGRLIKQLKVVSQAALDEGIHQNTVFRDKRFETLSERVMNIALTEPELNSLLNLNLSSKIGLELVRDIFLIGCFTALRWSDYSKIYPDHIIDNRIVLIQQKTKEKVIVPIKPQLENLLSKYPKGIPKIAEQTFNRKIKEIAKLAGINTVISIKETKSGVTDIVQYFKYQLISSHTARRTGATLMFKSKISTLAIMKITGHKTESSFMKYICITEEENADILETHNYFLN
ncbi:MAG: tyrosine-type recombinase/integrase [Saprospiraceae bacterium]|nr:tyrosine-type recombinase/integrase [Saprospiraceae bacterium]